VSQHVNARPRAKEETPKETSTKKNLEALFVEPPKAGGVAMATKLDEIQQQIEALQKQKEYLLSKERAAAIESINAKIKALGITAKDLDFAGIGKKTIGPKAAIPVKYKSGDNSWSGRGRQPKWVADHITKGGKLDDLLIK
jgi:DNA-binding protein H-NS